MTASQAAEKATPEDKKELQASLKDDTTAINL
jgi:hypothetical protein